jgi:hypothetical protein
MVAGSRQPALGWVQPLGSRIGDQRESGRASGVGSVAAVSQKDLVLEAREGDGQLPDLLPRAAVVSLNLAAIASEAMRAVPDLVIE